MLVTGTVFPVDIGTALELAKSSSKEIAKIMSDYWEKHRSSIRGQDPYAKNSQNSSNNNYLKRQDNHRNGEEDSPGKNISPSSGVYPGSSSQANPRRKEGNPQSSTNVGYSIGQQPLGPGQNVPIS